MFSIRVAAVGAHSIPYTDKCIPISNHWTASRYRWNKMFCNTNTENTRLTLQYHCACYDLVPLCTRPPALTECWWPSTTECEGNWNTVLTKFYNKSVCWRGYIWFIDVCIATSSLWYEAHQIPPLKLFFHCLTAVFTESLEARCQVENEDVVGAAPKGDAPTTSEWSTILLPTQVRLILEILR